MQQTRAIIRLLLFAFFLSGVTLASASACGFAEAPGDCGASGESEARYMLLRVATAIKADKAKALAEFNAGQNGFRTQDTYVFCVGPDGMMTAHPSTQLRDHQVKDLHDSKGNYFIAKMIETAQPSRVLSIRYLFPRPGSSAEVPKTTYYTKADDQVCGVGVYDDDWAEQPAKLSRQQQMAHLRARLSAGMPTALSSDWQAYSDLVDQADKDQRDKLTKAQDAVKSAEAALSLDQ